MAIFDFLKKKKKGRPSNEERKQQFDLGQMMTELGVRTTSTILSYQAEENPDNRSIEQYIAMQENDGTVKAITMLFTMPIISTPIKVIAAEGDSGEREFVEDVLLGPQKFGGMSTPLPFVIEDMTRAIFEGFRVYEKVPHVIEEGPHKGKIGWQKLAPRDSKTVQLRSDKHGGFLGVHQTAYFGGKFVDINIPAEKCVLFTFQKSKHPLYGESILKTAFYHYDKKHKLYYLAHKRAEIDAVGLKILKLTKQMGPQEVSSAETAIDTVGVNSRVTLPPGFELEVNRASNGYDVLPLIEHHDTQMMLSTLAQAAQMGTKEKYGYTYGAGYTAQGEFVVQMLTSIMGSIENTINEWVIPQLIDWNFGTQSYPRIKLMPLKSEMQTYLLKIFEELIKKDSTLVPPEFIGKVTTEVAEKLGIDITGKISAEDAAMKAFENGKKTIADQNKKPAPATDAKTKKEIKKAAVQLKDEQNFLEHFESLGRDYAFNKLNSNV